MKEQMKLLEAPELCFLTAFAGYRITDHKCNENMRDRVGETVVYTTIKAVRMNY